MSEWINYSDKKPNKGDLLVCEVDENRFVRKYFIMIYDELTEEEFKSKPFAGYFEETPKNLAYFEFVDGGIRDFDNTSFQVYLAHKYSSFNNFISYDEYIERYINRYKVLLPNQ